MNVLKDLSNSCANSLLFEAYLDRLIGETFPDKDGESIACTIAGSVLENQEAMEILGQMLAESNWESDPKPMSQILVEIIGYFPLKYRSPLLNQLEFSQREIQVSTVLASFRSRPPFIQWLHLIRFIMPRRLQLDVFIPCVEEITEDFYIAESECDTSWQRRWVCLAFSVRCVWLVLDLFRAVVADQTVGHVVRFFKMNPPSC